MPGGARLLAEQGAVGHALLLCKWLLAPEGGNLMGETPAPASALAQVGGALDGRVLFAPATQPLDCTACLPPQWHPVYVYMGSSIFPPKLTSYLFVLRSCPAASGLLECLPPGQLPLSF